MAQRREHSRSRDRSARHHDDGSAPAAATAPPREVLQFFPPRHSPATILFGSSACGSATKSTASCANLPPVPWEVLNMLPYHSSDESDDIIPDEIWKRTIPDEIWKRINNIEKRCSRRCSKALAKCEPVKGEAHQVCILSVQGGRDSAEPPQKKHKQEDAGVKLHVLKDILEEWSPVLRTKLESWCSSTQGGETIINIGEFTPEVTEHFTRFLYKAPPYLDHVNSTCCSPVCGDAPPCDAVARVLRGQLASRSGFRGIDASNSCNCRTPQIVN